MEKFKEISDYPGYSIGNLGTIIGNRGKPLKPCNVGGYHHIWIRGKNVTVHKLVGLAWVEGWETDLMINHKKGVKTDNRASELEWITGKKNMEHASETGLLGINPHRKRIGQYDKVTDKLIKAWGSATDAAEELSLQQTGITNTARGTYKTSGGYVWRYL